MNRKIIYYGLIVAGALDLIIWAITGFEFGWLEFVVGVNFISKQGAWIMIALGLWLLRKESAKEKSDVDDISDLEEGEEIIHKQVNTATIITVTNKKLIYRCFDEMDDTTKNHNNVLVDEKVIISFGDIDSVKPVKTKETAKTKLGGALNGNFGIQIKLRDGNVHNLPTGKGELICAHISRFL